MNNTTEEQIIHSPATLDNTSESAVSTANELMQEGTTSVFSCIATAIKDVTCTNSKTTETVIKSNDKSTESVNSSYDKIIDSCQKELDNGQCSAEKEMWLREAMRNAAEHKEKKDTENKLFLLANKLADSVTITTVVGIITAGVVAFACKKNPVQAVKNVI